MLVRRSLLAAAALVLSAVAALVCFGGGKPARAVEGGSAQPLVAVLGASFSAGVGTDGRPQLSWPADFGRDIDWQVKVAANPGSGYLRTGQHHRGDMATLLTRLPVNALHPRLVIVQAGHDDIGEPPAAIAAAVRSLVAQIRFEAPAAHIVLLTVFSRGMQPTPAAVATDRAIVTAASTMTDVTVVDPMGLHWRFATTRDHLHPTPAGDAVIARDLAVLLHADGLTPAPHGQVDLRARPAS